MTHPTIRSWQPAAVHPAEAPFTAAGEQRQLAVWQHDRLMINEAVGCRPDALFWALSLTKPVIAVAIHQLTEHQRLHLDQPVALWWPGFAARGKEQITLGDVLTHRSGLSGRLDLAMQGLLLTRPKTAAGHVRQARPRRRAGQTGYAHLAYGTILGEIIHRVSGQPTADYLHEHVFTPLGMHDTYLGLPVSEQHRAVPIFGAGPLTTAIARYLNRPTVRHAATPAAGLSTTAHDLIRLYRAIAGGGILDGARVLRQQTIDAALDPHTHSPRHDHTFGRPITWAAGFQLADPGC